MLLGAAVFAQGEDFATTNRDRLGRFWELIETKARPVRVLSFGDSMADSYRSPSCFFIRRLEQQFGVAGYSFNNYANALMFVTTNTVDLTGPDTNWLNRYFTLAPGGAVWWERLWSPGGNWCNQAGLFYVANAQGGSLTLSVSTNAGPWSPLLTLDCFNPTPVGRFTNVNLASGFYRVCAQSLTGTNVVLGSFVESSATNGIHISFLDWPGISLAGVTNVPRAIREPIIAALQPDLTIWHMKESGDLITSNRMNECEAWWHTSHPAGEVLYLGTPWTYYDSTSTLTPDQNRVVRGVALAHSRAYVDLMLASGSYDWLLAQGYVLDAVHLSPAGGQWCANVMWDDLGLFALGRPRQINLSRVGGQWQVTYPTAGGVIYSLQTSADLRAWNTVASDAGIGQVFTNNFPVSSNSFFRLELTPAH